MSNSIVNRVYGFVASSRLNIVTAGDVAKHLKLPHRRASAALYKLYENEEVSRLDGFGPRGGYVYFID